MFGGMPDDTWVRRLTFVGGLEELMVAASTLSLNYSMCSVCGPLPGTNGSRDQFPGSGSNSSSHVLLQRGLEILVKGAGLAPDPHGRYSLLGSEAYLREVAQGTTTLAMRMYQSVEGCLWPSTEELSWELVVPDHMVVRPLNTVRQLGDIRFVGVGLAARPHFTASAMIQVSIEENDDFTLMASFASDPTLPGSEVALAVLSGLSTDWVRPFNVTWISVASTNVTITTETLLSGTEAAGTDGMQVVSVVTNGHGKAILSVDPFTASAGVSAEATAKLNVTVRGTAGRAFPQFNAEVEITGLKQASFAVDPASVVRTMLDDIFKYRGAEESCSSIAGQDVSFDADILRVMMSSWDGGQFDVPEIDIRYRSCVATRGSVLSGTPCRFPFEYSGKIYSECTSTDWDVPWCSTTAQYRGEWGECSCAALKRGVSFTAAAAINPSGPLSNVAGTRLPSFLSTFSGLGYNVTAEVYFPLFDPDAEPNDLQLSVSFLPKDPANCGTSSATYPPIAVGSAPTGDCEDIGFVTVLDEEGTQVCQAPEDIPAGVALEEYLVYASTQAQRGAGGVPGPASRASLGEPDVGQACLDAGLWKEMSLCAEERVSSVREGLLLCCACCCVLFYPA